MGSIESRCICQRKAESNCDGGDSGDAKLRRVRSEMSGGTRGGARITQYMSCPLYCYCWLLPPSPHQIPTSCTPRSRGVNSDVLVEPVCMNPSAFSTRGAAQLAHGYHSRRESLKHIARTKGIVCKKVSYIRRYREQSQSNELTIGQSGLTL